MTKRRQIKEALLNNGEPAARKLAAELHIGAKRLERWFNQWLKGRAPTKVEAKDGCPFGRGESVRYKADDPKWLGVITTPGIEVSEVRWPNGIKQFVSNEVIRRGKRRKHGE